MKNLKLIILLLFASSLFTLTSCGDDEDYIDPREPFYGTYDVVESCENDTLDLTLSIVDNGSRGDEVFIEGDFIYGLDQRLTGIVAGARLTLPAQAYFIRTDPDLYYEFSGDGLLADGELRLTYSVYRVEQLPLGIDERYLGDCELVMTQQP